MINKSEREQIIALINREVVPAIGCTEPIAVALCVAKATETLGCRPEKIQALLSANILKNAMGVGIPGTGMIGLPIAIALIILLFRPQVDPVNDRVVAEELPSVEALMPDDPAPAEIRSDSTSVSPDSPKKRPDPVSVDVDDNSEAVLIAEDSSEILMSCIGEEAPRVG